MNAVVLSFSSACTYNIKLLMWQFYCIDVESESYSILCIFVVCQSPG